MTAELACPPSEVADTITEWTAADGTLNVAPGDLVLRDGAFDLVAEISDVWGDLLGNLWIWVRFEGDLPLKAAAADLVAVRRYITDEPAGAGARPDAWEAPR